MKRHDLIRHLESHGCYLLRDRGKHSVYVNPANRRTSAVPRHREINDYLQAKFAATWGFPNCEDQRTLGTMLSGQPSAAINASAVPKACCRHP
jgi:mRNA interferase HicA